MIPPNFHNQGQAKQRKVPLYLAFAVPFTLQVVGIVGLVGYLSYRSGQQTVQGLTNQLLVKTENKVVQELDDYLGFPHEINQFNIAMVESGVVDLENLDQLHNYLITEHQKFPQITSVLFGSPEGEFLLAHRVSALQLEGELTKVNPPQELRVKVGRSDPDDSSCLNLYALDQEGTMGRYLKTLKEVDVRERPWYRRAVKSQTSGWSDLFQIGASNILAINAYAPFYNTSQELEGVFSINLSLEVLSEFLTNLTVSNAGETFILERNGLLVANSAGELPYRTSRGKKGEILKPGNVQFHRIPAEESSNQVITEATAALKKQFNGLSTIQSPQQIEFAFETDAGKKDPYFLRVLAGETVTYEKELTYQGEKTRYVSAVLTPKFDGNNHVLGYYALITDISDRKQLELELEQANQELKQLATVDGLTQIANRRAFDKRLQEEWNRSCRESLPLSLLFCDVDYFKKYNDCYGHQAGDDCLQRVALIIKENCKRAEDFPARYGGEELAIICMGMNADKARNLAKKIQKQLFHTALPHEGNPNGNRVTLSIGIASMIPKDSHEANDLLGEADRALYLAKEQGRDRVISFQG